jgi:hypothetical protein
MAGKFRVGLQRDPEPVMSRKRNSRGSISNSADSILHKPEGDAGNSCNLFIVGHSPPALNVLAANKFE